MAHIDTIREVVDDHQLVTISSTRHRLITNRAGCSCDPSLEFPWYQREDLHREHVLIEVFLAGRESVARERSTD